MLDMVVLDDICGLLESVEHQFRPLLFLVSIEKSDDILEGLSLCVLGLSSLLFFNIISLFFLFSILIIMCCAEFLL